MVNRSRRKRRQNVMGNHQRCWIWGRHVVTETLRQQRWIPREVYLSEQLAESDRGEVISLVDEQTSVEVLTPEELTSRCHTKEHQGYLAKMPPFPYLSLADLRKRKPKRSQYLLLDAIQDPFNLGAMIRSAEGLGICGLIVGSSHQAEINSQVVRSSAGAVNSLPIYRVEELTEAITALQTEGFQIVGTSQHADRSSFAHRFCERTVLVIGNEGQGIRPELLEGCDVLIQIPQPGQVESLNAAVSAGILCYEMTRQQLTSEEQR